MPSGLESFPVALSYSIIGSLVLALSFYDFRNKFNRIKVIQPMIGLAGSAVIILGVLVSDSRSGILGIGIGMIASVILVKKTGKKYIGISTVAVLCALLVFISIFFAPPTTNSKFKNVLDDGRISGAWSIFIPIISQEPFGLPGYTGSDFISTRIATVGQDFVNKALKANKGYDPHNFILTTMLFYGIPAGMALLFLYLVTIHKGLKASKIIIRLMPTITIQFC